jgi:hypothetical protein
VVSIEGKIKRILIDERVKYHTFTRFKAKVRDMQRCEIESFKHWEDIWQIEEEAVLVPYDMWMTIQRALLAREELQ